MKSGLEGRNNPPVRTHPHRGPQVSMKSGLEGRNNDTHHPRPAAKHAGLNEVRPRRPEQFAANIMEAELATLVSMKSRREGRNNTEIQ